MNRLVIIGNGFDLAHHMKTTYYDFIFWYFKKACTLAFNEGNYSDDMISINKSEIENPRDVSKCSSFADLIGCFRHNIEFSKAFGSNTLDEDYDLDTRPFTIKVKGDFIPILFNRCSSLKWVDIEDEFYEYLKSLLVLTNEQKASGISKLNRTMKTLISELNVYMAMQNNKVYIRDYKDLLNEPILSDDIATHGISENQKPESSLILNFNYTQTVNRYIDFNNCSINYIHGKINDKRNPLIFGFGDELDDNYKKIEFEKTKGFLNYIKSFWYLKTSNYHNLIRFIESRNFQVYVLGHSCSLSDRTMLNMIFEHDNCLSIKIFYHEVKSGNNFEELTQEISRHFNNKGEMRKRIVPFDKSFPMPQRENF